jgi:tetratricopeptide (TPR) repeat protein
MPMSGSIDIPNVKIHDHFIRKPEKLTASKVQSIRKFVRLACVSDAQPDNLTKAKAYLNYYEEYETGMKILLDSANQFLNLTKVKNTDDFHFTMIRYLFLKENYSEIISYSNSNFNNESIKDAWTNYRVGEAFSKLKQYEKALPFFEKSIQQKPKEIDFLNKYGECLFQNNRTDEAEKVFNKVLSLNKKNEKTLTDLGFLNVTKGKLTIAESYYQQALYFNPDYEQAEMNLAALYNLQHQKQKAIVLLKQVLKKNKNNSEAKLRLEQIQKF